MLYELFIALMIAIGMISVTQISSINKVASTTDGLVLLRQKYVAINTNETQSFIVKDGLINNEHGTGLIDCTLAWASTGNASKSGTCYYENGEKLTLKVGDGGIGYAW